jgi:serine/threonine-protein kinase
LARGVWAKCIERDSRLNRDVAIKILPSAFSNDSNRMSRFQREAQVLAALS